MTTFSMDAFFNDLGATIPTKKFSVIEPKGSGRVWTLGTSLGSNSSFITGKRLPPRAVGNVVGGTVPNPTL